MPYRKQARRIRKACGIEKNSAGLFFFMRDLPGRVCRCQSYPRGISTTLAILIRHSSIWPEISATIRSEICSFFSFSRFS